MLDTVYWVLCIGYCVLGIVYWVLCIGYCVLGTVYCVLHIVYLVFCIVYCVLCLVYRGGRGLGDMSEGPAILSTADDISYLGVGGRGLVETFPCT